MGSESLHVSVCQAELYWHDASANREQFSKIIRALQSPGDLIVLPEMFNTGFTQYPDQVAEPPDGPTQRWMIDMASESGAAICGSLPVNDGGRYYNRFLLIEPDGTTQVYDKRHLFGLGGETAKYSAGKERKLFELNGWTILPQVCYDLRFPVFSRNVDEAYDLAIYVANWPSPRHFAWKTLLAARAIENQCYLVGVNRSGVDGNEIPYEGGSAIHDYLGHPQAELQADPGVISATLERAPLEKFRQKFPFLLDRDRFRLEIDN